jgi:hypothetical protein
MDKLAGDGPMAVFGAAVPLGIGAEGRPLLAFAGRNGTLDAYGTCIAVTRSGSR